MIFNIQMQLKEYQPFQYPPDYELARIHKQASKPGKVDLNNSIQCPCCKLRTRQPLTSWFNRSIDHDFKQYGGAVITYFWLVKLYAFVSLLVLIIYSSYLIASIHRFCSEEIGCERFLGIWIINSQSLLKYLNEKGQMKALTRIYTLRTMTYVILLVGNLAALYISGRFKRRYPQPKGINHFSLIFKNVLKSPQQFVLQLKQKFPEAQVVQMFNIKKMEPYYSLYNQKLQTYFLALIEQDKKKKIKLLRQLEILQKKCNKYQQYYQEASDRIIAVFQQQVVRNAIKQAYQLKGIDKFKYIIGIDYKQKAYCQQAPIPTQIVWNNIGSNEKQKFKLKILSVFYFFALIGLSYLFLFFCMRLVYDRQFLQSPWNVIVGNVVMTLMVPIALTFRQLMNKLSQMRRPNTLTNRTIFIILTTVLFHFIYYIIIPTFYLKFSQKVDQNKVLFIVTNQTFNFLIVQYILAYLDFVYCQWNKRLKKVQDQSRPIGCQKILHNHMQYPRFPIEFKLIILFKTYSFIILFAFESPLIMFLCFALMIVLYLSDKFAVYRHYRMEIIDNGVQFKFLKIYSIFFSFYAFLIYSLTQHFEQQLIAELYIAFILMVVAVFIQIFLIKDRVFEDETILPSTMTQEKIEDSYKARFNKFRQDIIDEKIDSDIKQFLNKCGYGSLQTQESLENKQKLIQ